MSDQDNSLFDSHNDNEPAVETNTQEGNQPPALPPELEELVGDGRKYRTPEDALKSVPHAQKHIQELESTLEELRTELTRRTTLEEALEKLRQDNTQIANGEGDGTPPSNALDPESLAKLVEGVLEKKETSKVQAENQKTVVNSLSEVFGDKAREVHEARLKEIGMSQEEFTSLASRSPKAALALFPEVGRGSGSASGGASTGSVNTEHFSGSGQVKQGTYAWYSQMRKSDPKKYFSREIQVEMARKAKELGSAFYN